MAGGKDAGSEDNRQHHEIRATEPSQSKVSSLTWHGLRNFRGPLQKSLNTQAS